MLKLITKLAKIIFYRNFILFFLVSGTGLGIDLLVFFLLSKTPLDIFFVNVISSFCAVGFVYFCSTKHIFENAALSAKNFTVFILYYAASIFFFSLAIKLMVLLFAGTPILAKIAVVPFSFLANYFFASRIISKRQP